MKEDLESQALELGRPAAVVVEAERWKKSPGPARQPISRRFFRDDSANGTIPGPKEGFFEYVPALGRPRVSEFFLDCQAQLPNDFKPAVAVIESPAHAGLRHWRVVVLIEDGKALEELSGEFRIHREPLRRRREFVPPPVVYVE
jgi:hypothetical protein